MKMNNILTIFLKKKNLFHLYIIFCWITSWTAIGINPGSLFDLNLTDILYFFRGIIPLFNFLLLIFFIFYHKKIFPIKNIFFLLFFFYFILQIVGLIYNKNNYLDLYYLVNCFNVLVTTCFAFEKKDTKIRNILFYILLIFISFNFLYFFFINFIIFIKIPYSMYMGWGHVLSKFSDNFGINSYIPNVLGISRNGLILFILLFLYNESKKNILTIIIAILLPILAACLILLQSRAAILIYLFFIFFYFIFFIKKKFFITFKYILFFLIIPVLIFSLINYIKFINLSDENKKIIETLKKDTNTTSYQYWLNKPHYLRQLPKGNFSSDRIDDWKNLINLSKSTFFGFGPQGDRKIYNKTASNGLVYAFVCSGYIGVIIFATICILSSYRSLIFLVKNKSNKNQYTFFSAFMILFLLLRSMFETSFAVFGIDYLIFIYAIFYVQYNLFNKKI
jgi:hypothetical protein